MMKTLRRSTRKEVSESAIREQRKDDKWRESKIMEGRQGEKGEEGRVHSNDEGREEREGTEDMDCFLHKHACTYVCNTRKTLCCS